MLLSNCISDLNHCSKIFILSRFDSYYPQIYQTQCCKVLSSETQGQGICLKNFFFSQECPLTAGQNTGSCQGTGAALYTLNLQFLQYFPLLPTWVFMLQQSQTSKNFLLMNSCICLSCSYPRTICDFLPSALPYPLRFNSGIVAFWNLF